MAIDEVDRVGINTSTPLQALDINGISLHRNTSFFGTAGAAGGEGFITWSANVGNGEPGFVIRGLAGRALELGSDAMPRMLLTSSGSIGIGTVMPTQSLDVVTQSLFRNTLFFGPGSVNGGEGFFSWTGNVGNREPGFVIRAMGGRAMELGTNNLPRIVITADGNVGIGTAGPVHPLQLGNGAHVTAGGVWTNASSRALKDRIAPLKPSEAFQALDALQPVTFVYKADPGDPQVGFIAEDVPELVATTGRTSLSSMDIVAVLTKVVQEQRVEMHQQRATITTPTDRLADLERRLAEIEAARQQPPQR